MELKKRKLLFKASSHMSGVMSSCQEGKNFGGNEGNRANARSGIDDVWRHQLRWRENL